MLRLIYLPANQAYAFTFGDALLRMGDEPMFFDKWIDAELVAREHNLHLSVTGEVTS